MGAKLSKKKKGYCLGAGKDGESTDTTEVEQKETENQEGQKDAAEPKGEKAPNDQSQNNGINEETKAEVTTKEESNQDQNPEIKSGVEEKDQPQGKKDQDEGKAAASEQTCEKEKVKGASEDKTKTECEVKETPAVAADKPTQESKPVKENEGSESHSCEPKQSAPVKNEVEGKQELVTKVEVEQTGKAPAPVGTEGNVLEKATEEVPTGANKSDAEPEKVPEKVEPSTPKSVTVEPVPEPVAETVESKPVIKIEMVEPEIVESSVQLTEEAKPEEGAVPENVDSPVPNSDSISEPVPSSLPESVAEPVEPATKEPELAPEPEPSQLPEPVVEPALAEKAPEIIIEAPAPEKPAPEQDGEPEKVAEPVPCSASVKMNDTKQENQEITTEPLPPKSTEVPDETANAQEHTENQESLGCHDQGADAVTIQAPTAEAASIELPEQHVSTAIQNGPSEISAEDVHAEVHPISTDLKVEDKEQQKEAVEENGELEKMPTQQESQLVKEDCNTPTDVLETSKNENDTKETHDAFQHNSEDKTENHDTEKIKDEKESPAPEILEKYGVGNGLPIKEEIKVHLENDCDKDHHGINGQSENHEIQVCNE